MPVGAPKIIISNLPLSAHSGSESVTLCRLACLHPNPSLLHMYSLLSSFHLDELLRGKRLLKVNVKIFDKHVIGENNIKKYYGHSQTHKNNMIPYSFISCCI